MYRKYVIYINRCLVYIQLNIKLSILNTQYYFKLSKSYINGRYIFKEFKFGKDRVKTFQKVIVILVFYLKFITSYHN